MRYLDEILSGRVSTAHVVERSQIESSIAEADVVIGAVLVPGARAPKLVTREMLGVMKKGAVIVDVAIDQGGCVETAHPTTHTDPVYDVDGITHYCVANMPGGVPITSTKALTNATLPYVEAIADHGLAEAVARDPALAPRRQRRSTARSRTRPSPRRTASTTRRSTTCCRLAAGLELLGGGLGSAAFGFFVGVSRTTSQVTPAASRRSRRRCRRRKPSSPRTLPCRT